jgi:hypothetical protein
MCHHCKLALDENLQATTLNVWHAATPAAIPSWTKMRPNTTVSRSYMKRLGGHHSQPPI